MPGDTGLKKLPESLTAPRDVEYKSAEWELWCAEFEEFLGRPICGVKGRRSGAPCASIPVGGRERCRWHGGNTLQANAHPHFKHGRTSKLRSVLPDHLDATFEASINDETLLELRADIALLDARIVELAERTNDGDPVAALDRVRELAQDIIVAIPNGEMVKAINLAEEIQKVVEQGVASEDVWDKIVGIQEQRRKHVDTERKRLESLQAYVTSEWVLGFVKFVIGIIAQEVRDKKTISAIISRVEPVLSNKQLPPGR